jgi:hypothetical protein
MQPSDKTLAPLARNRELGVAGSRRKSWEQRGRLRFAKAPGFLEVEAYLLPGGTIPFVELRLDR